MDDILDPLAPKLPDFARGMRILLVDGDTSSLMYMASMLEAYSYKVTTIELPAIAMPVYVERRDQFDAVIVNVHLDKAAEVEFVEELLNKDWTPIIVMSTVGVSVLREQPAFARARHFLKKPVSGCQLRGVWQHIYKDRAAKRGFLQEIIDDGNGIDPMQIDGNEAERVQMEGVNGNERVQTKGVNVAERVQTEGLNENERVQTEGVNETERVQTKGMNEIERVQMEGVKETEPVQMVGNETERVQMEGMLVAGKGVGIVIGEGEDGYGTAHKDEVQAGDPKGKNEQVEGASRTDEQLKTTEADKNPRTGGRKRAKDGDNNGGRKKYKRRNTSSTSKDGNKKPTGKFLEARQNIRWTRELHFKFTAAISKLGEAMATPMAIQETMNVPGLGLNQIAQELEKYKAQVQIIMAACELTPREIPPYEPPAKSTPSANGTTRVPPPQKQQGDLVGTGTNPPVQTFPPLFRHPGSLDHLQPLNDGIAPGYLGPNDQGQGRHQGIQISERPTLPPHPTPLQTNNKGKGKEVMEFQGDISPPYAPSLNFWQNPSPSLNCNGLFEETLMGEASSSVNPPPNSNLPPAPSNTAAGTSANQNVPDNPVAGQSGLDEGTDDLSWLSEWLGKSLTNDDIDPATFDWLF